MNTYVYVISCPLGLVRVGVASHPERRVRNLQIGSPVPLEVADQYPMVDLPSAHAVEAALNERFLDRRERGKWFRATPAEVRHALGDRSMIDLYRPSEAAERAQARLAAAAAAVEAKAAAKAASAAERRRLRRERERAAAGMLGQGMTQAAVADACAITDRTIRNWLQRKGFQSMVERARARAERQAAAEAKKEQTRRERNARRRYRRQNPDLWADLQARRPELRSPFEQQRKRKPVSEQPSRPGRAHRWIQLVAEHGHRYPLVRGGQCRSESLASPGHDSGMGAPAEHARLAAGRA